MKYKVVLKKSKVTACIEGDIPLHAGIGEALRHTVTVAPVGDLLSDLR